ncbi:hypothetical protein FHS90_003379 [Rufibacter quisquiliarum]|uniref:Uncharacterized protein n=1 Tax=Rufibacter quisquiliarum TaxID=1549639 RepID=A0A839GPC9_9BACT|nr:hypothetical protein [Rufibacter quisquiliarum]
MFRLAGPIKPLRYLGILGKADFLFSGCFLKNSPKTENEIRQLTIDANLYITFIKYVLLNGACGRAGKAERASEKNLL